MKLFFKDHENKAIINEWNGESQTEIIAKWNKEIPQYIIKFDSYKEDRNSVIYLTLLIEIQIDEIIQALFPAFYEDGCFDKTNTYIRDKIKTLKAFRLLPTQILDSIKCINYIRNEFAHEIKLCTFEDFSSIENKRKTRTIDKLVLLTNEYEGDYRYEETEDTLKNRFKSLCLNTITALRLFVPQVRELRLNIEQKTSKT